jgi:hypothetical protein
LVDPSNYGFILIDRNNDKTLVVKTLVYDRRHANPIEMMRDISGQ